jgi:hypothetical protein
LEGERGGGGGGGPLARKSLGGGGVGGELLHWVNWKICPDSLWKWVSLSTGAAIVPRETWRLGGEARMPGSLKDG